MTFEQELMIERREGIAEGMEKGMEKGMVKGIEKGKLEDAGEMLKDGIPLEKVIQYTGLAKEVIERCISVERDAEIFSETI